MIETNIDGSTLVLLLTFIVSTVLPLLVGIVTTRVTSPAAKAVTLAVLSFAASIISEIVDALVTESPYDLIAGLFKFGAIFLVAVGTYFGVWSRPLASGTSISSKLVNDVGRK